MRDNLSLTQRISADFVSEATKLQKKTRDEQLQLTEISEKSIELILLRNAFNHENSADT